MRTDQRLTEAYLKARVAHFDENSRYVFISDCHRGNGNSSDEFTKNQNAYLHAMDYYYKNGFVYVEAGDGDELWEHPRFVDIKNAHYEVYESIRRFHDEKRLFMLYGNHNIYLKNKDYVRNNYYTYYNDFKQQAHDFLRELEPCESLLLVNRKTGQEILTLHGHQGDLSNDQLWFFSMLSLKYFWRHLHSFGFTNPASPVRNISKRHRIEKNYVKWIDKHKRMLICGHTHRFKFPRESELPYFNTGCCIYPTSMTAIELIDGNIQIARWRVMVNSDGVLQVTRAVLRGPEPVEKFNLRLDQ